MARFRYVGNGSHAHRDALEFPSGMIVLLTRLCEGQHATVLQLPAISHVEQANANDAPRRLWCTNECVDREPGLAGCELTADQR